MGSQYKKYKLSEEETSFLNPDGSTTTLYRIVALRDFADVKKGDLGGFIEKENNLSHEGNAWVYDDAKVFNDAIVMENATVRNCAIVTDRAIITDYATVKDYAQIMNNAYLMHKAFAIQKSMVIGNAIMSGNSAIKGNAIVGDNVRCCDYALIEGDCSLFGDIKLEGMCHIYGAIYLHMAPVTLRDADIFHRCQIIACLGFGSRFGSTVIYRNADGFLSVTCGCFTGSIDEFKKEIKRTHGKNIYAKEYKAIIKLIKTHDFGVRKKFNIWNNDK